MAVDDVYYLQLLQRYAGQQLMNVLAFRRKVAADPTPAECLSLADDWKQFFIAAQVTTLSRSGWIVQQIRGGTVSYTSKPCVRQGGLQFIGVHTGTLTGTVATDGMPPQSAIVTTLATGISGRRRRGRLYLPGFPESWQVDGTTVAGLIASYITGWGTQLGKFGTSGTDPNWQLGVWSMTEATGCTRSTQPPFNLVQTESSDPAAAWLPVSTTATRNIVYSQRRRTIGVGR